MGWSLEECTCPCAGCLGASKWCIFLLMLTFRTIHAIWTHFVYLLIILLNCLYFQLWKSYDIAFFWVHALLCLCVPSLRRSNMMATVVRLYYHKYKTPEKSLKQIYLDKVRQQTEFVPINDDEVEETTTKQLTRITCCTFRGYGTGIEVALLLYRLRTTIAIIQGTLHQKLVLKSHPVNVNGPLFGGEDLYWNSTKFKKELWEMSWIGVYMDIAVFWFMVLIAYCRQCRLCCVMGCCRFIMWTIVIFILGVLIMELPMRYVERHLDGSLCKFVPDNTTTNAG